MTEVESSAPADSSAQSGDRIDAIIQEFRNEAEETAPETQAPQEQGVNNTEQPEPQDTLEGQQEEQKPEGDYVEGRKVRNALEKRNKKITKLRAQRDAAWQENARLRSQNINTDGIGEAPNLDDYENYEQYVAALAQHHAKAQLQQQEAVSHDQRLQDAAKSVQDIDTQLEKEYEAAIDDNYREALEALPDFKKLIELHATQQIQGQEELAVPMSEAVRSALLQSDNGAYAFYQILKDGALDSLNHMPAMRAAMEVARYEDMAMKSLTPKPKLVSDAPEPMPSAKGTAPAETDIYERSGGDILKWARSQ